MIGGTPPSDFNPTKGGIGNGDIITFVGTQIFTREAPDRPFRAEIDLATGEETIFISMDTEWQSRYQILDLISGNYDGETIDFTAFDHYGKPTYSAETGPILLFVHDLPRGRVHNKYNFKRVGRTLQSEWAICGSPYAEDAENKSYPYSIAGTEAPPLMESIHFDPPFTIDINALYRLREIEDGEALTDQERAEWQAEIEAHNADVDEKYRAPTYERLGDTARCLRGIPVERAVRHELRTDFRISEVRNYCQAQLSHTAPDGQRVSEGESFQDYNSRRKPFQDALKACFDNLYPSGWPYTE